MSTMGIGFVTLSVSSPSGKGVANKKAEETLATKTDDTKEPEKVDTSDKEEKTEEKAKKYTDAAEDTKVAKGVKDDGSLMENAYPEVNALISQFLDARAASDIDTIERIVSKTNPITISGLQKEAEYIEAYKNISCYTLKGLEKGSFIVYIYEDLKLVGIDTLAPGMTRVYVCTGEDGKLYINFGEVDDKTRDAIEKSAEDKEVVELINNVNTKLEEAMTKDPALKVFAQNLNKAQGDADKKSTGK